jgi:hypothetical protein
LAACVQYDSYGIDLFPHERPDDGQKLSPLGEPGPAPGAGTEPPGSRAPMRLRRLRGSLGGKTIECAPLPGVILRLYS